MACNDFSPHNPLILSCSTSRITECGIVRNCQALICLWSMSECHACFTRYLRALVSSYQPRVSCAARRLHSSGQQTASFHASSRTYQSLSSLIITDKLRGDISELPPLDPDDAQPQPLPRQTWGQTQGRKRQDEMRLSMRGRSNDSKRLDRQRLLKELQYLQDPLKLADHIRYVLQNDDEAKAQALVRLSSRAMANTISWNHLIDYQMKQGRTKAALETYNEVRTETPH